MKFIKAVQNQEISWPTQPKFDVDNWRQLAAELSEDEADLALAQTGLWCADALAPLREQFVNLGIWSLSRDERTRIFLGAANRVFYSITYLSDVKDESKGIWFSAIPEKLMDSIKLPSYGSAKATDLVETAVEDAERCMKQSGSRAKRGELRSDLLGDYGLAMSLVGAYQSIEFIFHRALWLDWRLIEEDDYWFFVPSDIDSEKRWEASLRRFESLEFQAIAQLQQIFVQNDVVRMGWLHNAGPLPRFTIREEDEWLLVEHSGDDVPTTLPFRTLRRAVAQKFYYAPLLNEPIHITISRRLRVAVIKHVSKQSGQRRI